MPVFLYEEVVVTEYEGKVEEHEVFEYVKREALSVSSEQGFFVGITHLILLDVKKSKKRMRLKDMSNEEMANLFKF